MIEFYPQIKTVHVAAVMASGSLFALRGLLLLAGQRWAKSAPIRYLSYTIDTTLLTAALMLLTVLRLNPFVVPWLSVKLGLILVYITLGWLAMRDAHSRRSRTAAYAGALACLVTIYLVARSHDPLGPLAGLLR